MNKVIISILDYKDVLGEGEIFDASSATTFLDMIPLYEKLKDCEKIVAYGMFELASRLPQDETIFSKAEAMNMFLIDRDIDRGEGEVFDDSRLGGLPSSLADRTIVVETRSGINDAIDTYNPRSKYTINEDFFRTHFNTLIVSEVTLNKKQVEFILRESLKKYEVLYIT